MSAGSVFDLFLECTNLIEHYNHLDGLLQAAEARGDLSNVTSTKNTMNTIYSKLHEAQFKVPIIICHAK